ncbi:hypothetical protein ACHHYP_20409 [Achlya hypogyna]|uniref:Tc1-like transposase DDE domain-containing protein n=1 Tax=Achlya hypogyna TaxID=1202772 RepID=A0A1V9YNH9_ACHHY|nr:hypothetical protein ACHHYP_20409 [Achlya hypogyna]
MHRLRRLGFKYLRGQMRNFLAESPANVAYRAKYLATKTSGGNAMQKKAKAIVSVLLELLKSKDDYHGNFTAELFEKWFRECCRTLACTVGNCTIHMDGAKYHKRQLNPHPNSRWRKSDIQNWLTLRSIVWQTSDIKASLLVMAAQHREPAQYVSVEIAREFNHVVLFTPPYHPELQPIEIIWACVKNRIGASPAKTMPELCEKLEASLHQVSSPTWLGALKRVHKFEDMYLKSTDNEPLADIDDDDSDDEEGATDLIEEFVGIDEF